MNWQITRAKYQAWKEFKLQLDDNILFSTGMFYHLKGQNGSGKSSFIRKVLLPFLKNDPQKQYIFYLEQMIQTQFDAVHACAALSKPARQITTRSEMVAFLMDNLWMCYKEEPRPVFIIIDEYPDSKLISELLTRIDIKEYCLVYTSHQKTQFERFENLRTIDFMPLTASVTKVSLG
jgi:ABC-type cobalamin/Fe3+-siderophores transport system ATPase subunit